MRKVLVLFVCSFHLASLAVAGVKTDRQEEGLMGPVRTVQIETTQFSNQSGQWVEGPRELSASVLYDSRGNKAEVTGSVFVGKTLYTYNAQGDRAETLSYSPDGSLSGRTVYTYDNKGNLSETVSDGSDGSAHRKTLYTYNAQGQLTEQISCDVAGCFDKVTYTYDSQGNLTEESFYYPSGSPIKLRLVHTYDNQGRRTQTESYDAHDPGLGIEKTVQTYDANGHITGLTTYYTYRAGDDEEERETPPPSKVLYSYEWDAHGNWVKQTQVLCPSDAKPDEPPCKPSLATYRAITYYPEAEVP